jgi:hypothetical protein
VPINVNYAGGAVQAIVSGSFTPTVPGAGGTFTVDDATGYPVSGAFPVKINRGLSDEEHILVSSRSGTTFTVGTRGYDGTTAQSHAANASCEIYFDAQSANLIVQHVDDVEADPHSTKLLNNTRHDVTARHQYGSGLAFGVPGTPTALTPDIAGAAGTGNSPAREDHAHNMPAATASTITDANAEGTSGSFARADHNHALAAGIITGTLLADGAVSANKLANNAVTTAKVLDAAITFAKLSQAATSFSPAWTNVVLGTGGAQWGHYFKLGRLVVGMTGFLLGTSGANVTGELAFTAPTTVDDLTGGIYAGQNAGGFVAARASESGVANWAAIGRLQSDRQTGFFSTTGQAAIWGATLPFNWEENDHLEAIFIYVAPS